MSQFDNIVSQLFADLGNESRNLLNDKPLYWAQHYLDEADRLFERGQKLLTSGDDHGGSGDLRSGALFMWRSCLCAIIAVAQKEKWPTETREDLAEMIEAINRELEEPVLINGFEASNTVRGYGGLSEITNDELAAAWVSATKFVRRLLELAD